jgi:hypothetical protein
MIRLVEGSEVGDMKNGIHPEGYAVIRKKTNQIKRRNNMSLGDGIGRNKGVVNWINSRQRDYFNGAEAFVKWVLSNEKYSACVIDTDEHCIVNDVGLIEDIAIVSADELLEDFKNSFLKKNEGD